MSCSLVFAFIAWASLGAGDAELFEIEVVVKGGAPSIGQVLVSLFDSRENYMKEAAFSEAVPVSDDGSAVVHLGRYPSGDYAVVAVYDENADGKLNTGLLGIPKEKIGYSNNAKGRFGPAKWKDVHFPVTDTDLRIEIQLKHVKRDE